MRLGITSLACLLSLMALGCDGRLDTGENTLNFNGITIVGRCGSLVGGTDRFTVRCVDVTVRVDGGRLLVNDERCGRVRSGDRVVIRNQRVSVNDRLVWPRRSEKTPTDAEASSDSGPGQEPPIERE
ncbi:MAG: hypothetical protein AAF533_23215 [Acidobacteriota bacterium]